MKIAITDACIFIDLFYLDLTTEFFSLQLEIHTSVDVIFELYKEQQDHLAVFISNGKLTTHNLTAEERNKIQTFNYPRSLSDSDKIVLYLASRLNAMVLSSDKTIRNTAKNKAIDYHGMIWIFDQLVNNNLITKKEASLKLTRLITTNLIYQNNKELVAELQKRLTFWS